MGTTCDHPRSQSFGPLVLQNIHCRWLGSVADTNIAPFIGSPLEVLVAQFGTTTIRKRGTKQEIGQHQNLLAIAAVTCQLHLPIAPAPQIHVHLLPLKKRSHRVEN